MPPPRAAQRRPAGDRVGAARGPDSRRLHHGSPSLRALRRGVDVAREQSRCIRNTLVSGDARHVHDVWPPLALDDVDAVQVDAEGPAAAQREVAQLRGWCEGLSLLLGCGAGWEDLLDPKTWSPITYSLRSRPWGGRY